MFNFLFLHLKCNVGPIDTCICRQEFFSKRIIMYVGDIHWRNLIFLLSISTLHNDKMNLYIVGLSFYQLLHFLIIINISSINTSNQFIFFGTDHFVKKWWFRTLQICKQTNFCILLVTWSFVNHQNAQVNHLKH